jgi:hypothetical protein
MYDGYMVLWLVATAAVSVVQILLALQLLVASSAVVQAMCSIPVGKRTLVVWPSV